MNVVPSCISQEAPPVQLPDIATSHQSKPTSEKTKKKKKTKSKEKTGAGVSRCRIRGKKGRRKDLPITSRWIKT